MCDVLMIEWRQAGIKGATLISATYSDGILMIETGPGQARLTAAMVRQFLNDKRRADRPAA